VLTARPSSRIASDASVASTALNIDGWVASPRTNDLATTDAPPSAHPNAAPASNSKVRGRETGAYQSPQWRALLGSTPGEQLKTFLAAIGLFTILFHGWRMLGKG
jgi:hypothetical protein